MPQGTSCVVYTFLALNNCYCFIILQQKNAEVYKRSRRHIHNETPTARGLAADNNNKLYTETMILCIGLSDNSIRNEDDKHTIMHRKYLALKQYHYNYNTVTTITLSLQ